MEFLFETDFTLSLFEGIDVKSVLRSLFLKESGVSAYTIESEREIKENYYII